MVKKQFSHNGISSKRLLGAAVALAVFFLLLMSVIRLATKYVAIKKRSHELAGEAAELSQKENELTATNAYLSTAEGTEQSLRERYNYVKPGEEMIIITGDTDTTLPPPHQSLVAHWWQELLRGLGID